MRLCHPDSGPDFDSGPDSSRRLLAVLNIDVFVKPRWGLGFWPFACPRVRRRTQATLDCGMKRRWRKIDARVLQNCLEGRHTHSILTVKLGGQFVFARREGTI
jgi:hypothetical protein